MKRKSFSKVRLDYFAFAYVETLKKSEREQALKTIAEYLKFLYLHKDDEVEDTILKYNLINS